MGLLDQFFAARRPDYWIQGGLDHYSRADRLWLQCGCTRIWDTSSLSTGREIACAKAYQEALACFEKAIELDQGAAGPWYHQAETLYSLGVITKKDTYFARCQDSCIEVLKRDENHEGARMILKNARDYSGPRAD